MHLFQKYTPQYTSVTTYLSVIKQYYNKRLKYQIYSNFVSNWMC